MISNNRVYLLQFSLNSLHFYQFAQTRPWTLSRAISQASSLNYFNNSLFDSNQNRVTFTDWRFLEFLMIWNSFFSLTDGAKLKIYLLSESKRKKLAKIMLLGPAKICPEGIKTFQDAKSGLVANDRHQFFLQIKTNAFCYRLNRFFI